MTPERWRQIEELYYAALERDASQWAAFLEHACGGDEALRREVESLMASHEQAGSFIKAPAIEVAAELMAEDQTRLAMGKRIGPYKVVRRLGAGGMGEVDSTSLTVVMNWTAELKR